MDTSWFSGSIIIRFTIVRGAVFSTCGGSLAVQSLRTRAYLLWHNSILATVYCLSSFHSIPPLTPFLGITGWLILAAPSVSLQTGITRKISARQKLCVSTDVWKSSLRFTSLFRRRCKTTRHSRRQWVISRIYITPWSIYLKKYKWTFNN